jgi:glutathione synthase/RimK-type ligase-like ATP-grasp enzyme
VILLCGIPSEEPLAHVAAALSQRGAPFALFNQRAVADAEFGVQIDSDGCGGVIRLGGHAFELERISGVYTRLMDDQLLPELAGSPPDSALRRHSRALHTELALWLELTSATVVNRAAAMATNASKPYQIQLIGRAGFDVPETLVTNDPELVLEFRSRHGRLIYKSTSSLRSIVRELDETALARLERIRWCPVQFQELVEGTDVRVHVVGDDVFATRISCTSTDYRYASSDSGTPPVLGPTELPDEVAERCVAVTRNLGLEFGGVDLRHADDGRWVCFEVNPSPAFSYYEGRTGQPIGAAVARHLCRGEL